jgi:alanine-synthesizing transaminase
MVAIAREHGLIIYADEVYDKVLYDGATHTAIASLSEDVLTITFNGLSKNYRSCGYRAGWMVVSGDLREARDYIEGLNMLASMRLCANVPGSMRSRPRSAATRASTTWSPGRPHVPPARPGARTDHRHSRRQLRQAEGGAVHVSAPRPAGLSDRGRPGVHRRTAAGRARAAGPGQRLQLAAPDHFRLVFLPHEDDLRDAIARIARFLEAIASAHGTWQYLAASRRLRLLRPFLFNTPSRDCSMKPINVGLLGIGTVGGGTYAVLKRNAEEITRRAGRPIQHQHRCRQEPRTDAQLTGWRCR